MAEVLKEIALNGKLRTADDPTTIGNDFQSLINMRYADNNPVGIGGMTKINTTALTTYLKMRSGFHFQKYQPAESHILVQAYNTGLTASQVLQNTTAVPSAGDFSATALWTDSSGAGKGRFSDGPRGTLLYCNGVDTCIWGGDEYEVERFINYHPDGTWTYDYTDAIKNTLTDALNVATLQRTSTAGAGNDSDAILLLHSNTDFTDSATGSAPAKTVTASGAVINTTTKKFGAGSIFFDGVNDYCSTPDHADFDFSDGTWTVDFWIYNNADTGGRIFYQQTDANNYISLYNTNDTLFFRISSAGSAVVSVNCPNGALSNSAWHHVALVENGDSYKIYIDGIEKGTTTDTDRPANYTGVVYLGSVNGASDFLSAYIDEFRVSKIARWTADFTPPVAEYSAPVSGGDVYMYVGSTRPLKGIKFYIGTVNTATGLATIQYWDGSAFVGVSSLTDGTASGGISLAQTGTMSFTSTVSTAKVKSIDGVVLYWYSIYVTGVAAGVTVTHVTVDTPFQAVKDIWDGDFRTPLSFQVYKNNTYNDYTVNIFEDSYDSANTATFVELDSLASATDNFVLGFDERQSGVTFHLIGGHVNTTANTVLVVKYSSDGIGWTTVGTVDDGTASGGISFAQSGTVTWNPPVSNLEFEKSISNEVPLFYYAFIFYANLSADVQLFYVGGIPAQKNIRGYSFPVYARDRVWLCDNVDRARNSALCSDKDAPNIYSGDGSTEFFFGDEKPITGGCSLYSRFGSSIYNITLFFKANEIWGVTGNSPEDFVQFQASDKLGCVAPLTLQTTILSAEGVNKPIAIWQGTNGIYIFDNNSPVPIHRDIRNYFDKRKSECINTDKIADSIAFIDEEKMGYHWLFASGSSTTLNKELVFDLNKGKWFEIDRGTGKYLQLGIQVKDTNGNTYPYGCIDTGYLERLEYGNNFDGTDITHTFHLSDIAPAKGSIMYESRLVAYRLICVAKATTTNDIAVTHYGDRATSGTSLAAVDPTNSGYRLAISFEPVNIGEHVFHSAKTTMVTNNESIGFEPLFVGMKFEVPGESLA
mgnify:CR=1 FL=1